MLEKDRRERLNNQHRLRELKRVEGGGVKILSAHDVGEFEQAARRNMAEPATG